MESTRRRWQSWVSTQGQRYLKVNSPLSTTHSSRRGLKTVSQYASLAERIQQGENEKEKASYFNKTGENMKDGELKNVTLRRERIG